MVYPNIQKEVKTERAGGERVVRLTFLEERSPHRVGVEWDWVALVGGMGGHLGEEDGVWEDLAPALGNWVIG